jgi:Ca2+-transporting ATPase
VDEVVFNFAYKPKHKRMSDSSTEFKGLTDSEVLESRGKYGTNETEYKDESGFWIALKGVVKEPMFILLLITSVIYFASGDTGDGIFMASAIVLVAAISLYQDTRSRNALIALKTLTEPGCRVIRNGITIEIKTQEVVIGDYIIVEEGTLIPADGVIVHANDFSVNESILTGESLAVMKSESSEDNVVMQGTAVSGGLAICKVTAIGVSTKLNKIGQSLKEIKEDDTPLQIQIENFVKIMVVVGAVVFATVWGVNFYHSRSVLDSLLKALTLAMSILPEEIPVAFTTFMALGAWRLMKMGIVVKQTKTVETLGSATVICTDKTGTITENKMELAELYVFGNHKFEDTKKELTDEGKALVAIAMWASEPIPFDPMEMALHNAYAEVCKSDERPQYHIVREYPLSGKPPMMTHVFENGAGNRIVAAKGAPEAIIAVSGLNETDKQAMLLAMNKMATDGYRVLGVGITEFPGNTYPEKQQDFKFEFKGLVAFYDPPKKNISEVFETFYKAGINVKIVTGDNATTTSTIARQIGFKSAEKTLNGDELMAMSKTELESKVMDINIFTRMFPEAKLKIIDALKAKGQIVAMTGDGVNDGPALKAAHIGIAMGKKGSEIAKGASSLILADDDLAKMTDAVAMGRKIYTNLKKAIRYIISIHIPIILTVFIPLILGWIYPGIFTPVHIIFLEMIMGPTCSIIFENEPMEPNTMLAKPRAFTTSFLGGRELLVSAVQGLVITAASLSAYQYTVYNGLTENVTRTMVFLVLISANIALTLVNRSFYYSVFTTIQYKNNLVPIMIGVTIGLTAVLLFLPAATKFFLFESLSALQYLIAIGLGMASVLWYEVVKVFKRLAANKESI